MNHSYNKDAKLSAFVEKMFDPSSGVMKHHRKGIRESQVKEFAKKNEITHITEEYFRNVELAWNNYFGKPSKKNVTYKSLNAPISNIIPNKVNLVGAEIMEKSIDNSSNTLGTVPMNVPPAIEPNPKITFRLKNAKFGEAYSEDLQVEGETETKKVVVSEVILPEGMTAQAPEFRKIVGSPVNFGDQEVLIKYRFQDSSLTFPLLSGKCNIYISPDPRLLWEIHQPPADDPYFKSNEDSVFLIGNDNLKLIGASRRGRSHEHGGTFRDDDLYLISKDGWNILAVADGAGSAKNSRKGSEIAVKRSVEFLMDSLQTNSSRIENEVIAYAEGNRDAQVKTALYATLGNAAFAAAKAIEEEASANGKPSKEYSTTLILGIHKKLAVGNLFAAYWVGDGGVGVYSRGQKIKVLGEPDSGEFAGQTRFLDRQVMTGEEIMKRISFTLEDDFTSFILMTDGVTDPKFETDSNLTNINKWDELWSELEPLLNKNGSSSESLLTWLEFWSPGNHDDRTIALLCK